MGDESLEKIVSETMVKCYCRCTISFRKEGRGIEGHFPKVASDACHRGDGRWSWKVLTWSLHTYVVRSRPTLHFRIH